MTRLTGLGLAFVLALAARAAQAQVPSESVPSAASADVEQDPVVARQEQAAVVYRELTGPYWSAGPRLADVREYQQHLGDGGALFVRYLDDPTATAPSSLRMQVGFFPVQDVEVAPPYTKVLRDGEWTVSQRLPRHAAAIPRVYEVLRRVAAARGFQAAGPLTEVHVPPEEGAAPAAVLVEFRLTLAPERHAERSSLATTPARSSEDADGSTSSAEGEVEASVASMYASQEYERLAERLIPAGGNESSAVWIGQAVLRLRALADGVERVYPGQGVSLGALCVALEHRYQTVAGASKRRALDQATIRVDDGTDPRAREKRAVIRDLDALLGRLPHRGTTAETVATEIIGLLERIETLTTDRLERQ
ncbi:MAG: hypothetical protein HY763_05295 [Planctomycetes bacterium]|nr:hypothetical protein [Planctomycetota bacterium]